MKTEEDRIKALDATIAEREARLAGSFRPAWCLLIDAIEVLERSRGKHAREARELIQEYLDR